MLPSLQAKLKNVLHKEGVNPLDWFNVHPDLLIILDYVIEHCIAHGLLLVVSSIIRPKIPGASKTDIHAKGRAFDISVRGWSDEDIQFLCDCINQDLTVGAISLRDNIEREAVFEEDEFDKNGKQTKWRHIHFQCAPRKVS